MLGVPVSVVLIFIVGVLLIGFFVVRPLWRLLWAIIHRLER